MNGLRIDVYSSGPYQYGDTTNGGISSRHDQLTLIGKGISGPFEPTPDAPAVTFIRRPYISGDTSQVDYVYLVPCDENAQPLPGWFMAGGNFAYTSDSRFPSKYPLSIHDRLEGADRDAARAIPADAEPVKVGRDLVVKFQQKMNGKIIGTWKKRWTLRTAGYKIAAELHSEPNTSVIGVVGEDRFELRPPKA